jgi:hypothetical protein
MLDDDSEDCLSALTPKRGLKPKLSSYFTHTQKPSLPDDITTDLPTWPPDELYPDLKAEEVLDGVMCRLMNAPYACLDVAHNSSLMLIFESYLQLKDERDRLHTCLESELATIQLLMGKFNTAEQDWDDEKQDYKAEVKRLEVLLAKASHRGVAEVTLARQDSRIRQRKSKKPQGKEEFILELLQKTKRQGDQIWNSQRGTAPKVHDHVTRLTSDVWTATMKPLLHLASDQDRKTSQRLLAEKSTTTVNRTELPFGTPPMDLRFSLSRASVLEHRAKQKSRNRAGTNSTAQSTSEDTFSTFSCEENVGVNELAPVSSLETASMDDFSSVEQIATALARRRQVDASRVMPQLLSLFGLPTPEESQSTSVPVKVTPPVDAPIRAPWTRAHDSGTHKPRTVMSKASGFFWKLRPQLTVDAATTGSSSRRFSFDPGDDSTTIGSAPDTSPIGMPANVKERILRKSVSLYALADTDPRASDRHLSPVAQSPTPSAPFNEGRIPSRIPTPVFSSGSLARPRQEREDSSSSLLTAIRHTEGSICSNSRTSSSYSSPQHPSVQAEPGSASMPRSSSSHRLVEYTNALRGTTPAVGRVAPVECESDVEVLDAHGCAVPAGGACSRLSGSGSGVRDGHHLSIGQGT